MKEVIIMTILKLKLEILWLDIKIFVGDVVEAVANKLEASKNTTTKPKAAAAKGNTFLGGNGDDWHNAVLLAPLLIFIGMIIYANVFGNASVEVSTYAQQWYEVASNIRCEYVGGRYMLPTWTVDYAHNLSTYYNVNVWQELGINHLSEVCR